jgi:hypothetical protein
MGGLGMIEPKRICQGLPWVMDGDRSRGSFTQN